MDNSDLDLVLAGNISIGGLVGNISGTIDVTCGNVGANGKRWCSGALESATTVPLIGIGFICVEGVGSCPNGEMDCDGGNALGIEAVDDHEIGTCASHADCSAQCDAYCAGIGKVQWRSGCESFCRGGLRDGLPCMCDTARMSGCVGGTAGINDCPGGTCIGNNNEFDTDCQCLCMTTPPPVRALPVFSSVTSRQTSRSWEVYRAAIRRYWIPLPSVLRSPRSLRQVPRSMQNEMAGVIGPQTLTGSSDTCSNFDAGVMTGYALVSNIALFDTTIGDLRIHLTLDCP